jgi:hypothetical protein
MSREWFDARAFCTIISSYIRVADMIIRNPLNSVISLIRAIRNERHKRLKDRAIEVAIESATAPFPAGHLPPETDPWWQQALGWAIPTLLLGYVAWALFMFGPAAVWYSLKYDVRVDDVMAISSASDCDFLRSPIGYKGCHYERTVESCKDAGEPRRVLLGWTKVSD